MSCKPEVCHGSVKEYHSELTIVISPCLIKKLLLLLSSFYVIELSESGALYVRIAKPVTDVC